MHKNDVRNVDLNRLSILVKLNKTSNDFNVKNALPKANIAFKDLQRTIVLIDNALPDMFYYLKNKNVHATTNALEGFHSRLKSDYQRHRGLTEKHKIQYINWYCFLKN